MKKLLLISFLLLFSNFFASCLEDDTRSEISNPKKYNKETISFKEFLITEKNNKEAYEINKYTAKKSSNDSIDWELDTTKVVKIIDNDITTYTFYLKEKSIIDGFRNIIVKIEKNKTTNYIVHYPKGVDFVNYSPREVIINEIDTNIFSKTRECLIVVYVPVHGCSTGTCEWGWYLEPGECKTDNNDSDDGGSVPPVNNDPIWDNDDGISLPTDPIRSGGGGISSYSYNTNYLSSFINFSDYEKQWLTLNPTLTDIFLQLLTLNNYSSEYKSQIKWVTSYLSNNTSASNYFNQNPQDLTILFALGSDFFTQNPNIRWEELKYLLYNKTSYESNLGDLDNNAIGGYDNTTYPTFDIQTQGWPNINPIISKNDFIGWGHPNIKRNCMDYAKAQIAIKGYAISNYSDSGQTFQIYTSNNGVNSTELSKGVSYIKYALTNNIPVIVGVDFESGSPNPGTDNTTDHFVVIVGMGSDSRGMYLIFYDNAVTDPNGGANTNNRLYYNSTTKKFQGQSQSTYGVDKIYTITMIRKSKRK